ncbi:MAG: hypothetical protein UZ21_OP11001000600 [Microgenomates bacterium OLB22]|nr:MAG: hypothetical protein UZ21_OP11001000600 [Microgenomates bacterium OLB22]
MIQIGEYLRQARESQKKTLESIAKETRIRLPLLEAIEKNDWSKLSSKTYAQGVVVRYGQVLGLDGSMVQAFFRRDYGVHDAVQFRKTIATAHYRSPVKRLAFLLLLFFSILFALFFSYQLYRYLRPPTVIVTSPTSQIVDGNWIELAGITEQNAAVTIDDQEVILNDKNEFRIRIPITEKEKKVSIIVVGANGRKAQLERTYRKK